MNAAQEEFANRLQTHDPKMLVDISNNKSKRNVSVSVSFPAPNITSRMTIIKEGGVEVLWPLSDGELEMAGDLIGKCLRGLPLKCKKGYLTSGKILYYVENKQ
jgi:hypothetical protein